MDADLDTLLTALYCFVDHALADCRAPGRPKRLTDAELVTLAVAQVLLERPSEAAWLRYSRKHFSGMFPYLHRLHSAAVRHVPGNSQALGVGRARRLRVLPVAFPHSEWRRSRQATFTEEGTRHVTKAAGCARSVSRRSRPRTNDRDAAMSWWALVYRA